MYLKFFRKKRKRWLTTTISSPFHVITVSYTHLDVYKRQDMELEAEQMEKIFEYLESQNIDVLRISPDTDDADAVEILLTDEDEVDMEKICLLYTSRCV